VELGGGINRKFSGDHVAQRVADVRARKIGLVNVGKHVARRITFPMHAFKILYQLLAAGIDNIRMLELGLTLALASRDNAKLQRYFGIAWELAEKSAQPRR
jgi:hypothetical protein